MPPVGEWFDYPRVRHYYGDSVRALFIAAAALMIVSSPLYATVLTVDIIFIIPGAIALVMLAGLSNPRKISLMIANAIASAVGAALYGIWAVAGYEGGSSIAFVLRGFIALILLLAFYFATKTVRARVMGQVGVRRDTLDDGLHDESYDEDEEDALFDQEEINKRANQERVSYDSD